MRPKDNAIEKLFYVLFSKTTTTPRLLAMPTNLYSQVMHGMRPFVASLIRMTHREHDNRPRKADANAQFAIRPQ